MTKLARTLDRLSTALVVFAWLFGVFGVIGGIGLAVQTGTGYTTDYLGDIQTTTTHPYVGLGIAVIAAALIQAVVVAWFGYVGKVLAVHDTRSQAAFERTFQYQGS